MQVLFKFLTQLKEYIYINPWLTGPTETVTVKYANAPDWQMAIRRDSVISITLR